MMEIWSHAFFFFGQSPILHLLSALLIHFGALSLLYASFVNSGGQKRYIIIYILMKIWGMMHRNILFRRSHFHPTDY